MNTRTLNALAIALLLATIGLGHTVNASSASKPQRKPLGNDESTFVFAGQCHDGQRYRLFSYPKNVDGVEQSFYDYEGPAGQGTVQTDAAPRVMAVRVCRAEAEISAAFR